MSQECNQYHRSHDLSPWLKRYILVAFAFLLFANAALITCHHKRSLNVKHDIVTPIALNKLKTTIDDEWTYGLYQENRESKMMARIRQWSIGLSTGTRELYETQLRYLSLSSS